VLLSDGQGVAVASVLLAQAMLWLGAWLRVRSGPPIDASAAAA
jgi:hypothetical protein